MKNLNLFPLDSNDDKIVEMLYSLRNSVDIDNYFTKSRIRGQTKSQISEMLYDRAKSDNFYYGIFFNNNLIGTTQAIWWDKVSSVVELGIHIFKENQGKGYSKISLHLLETRLVSQFRVRKYIVRVRSDNSISIKLFTDLGYDKVGTFKSHYYHDSKYHDIIFMEKIVI